MPVLRTDHCISKRSIMNLDLNSCSLGIELGSTRIKATLIGPDFKPVAPLLENTSVWASVTLTAPIAAIAFAYMVARRKRRASDFKGGRQ